MSKNRRSHTPPATPFTPTNPRDKAVCEALTAAGYSVQFSYWNRRDGRFALSGSRRAIVRAWR